jgi:2-phosphoglycerate kinase
MCRHVRKGCNFDIQKCFIDGKPLIIEGSHLEPNLYVKTVTDNEIEGGVQKLQIITPDPFDEEEAKLENEPMRKMRKAMNSIE